MDELLVGDVTVAILVEVGHDQHDLGLGQHARLHAPDLERVAELRQIEGVVVVLVDDAEGAAQAAHAVRAARLDVGLELGDGTLQGEFTGHCNCNCGILWGTSSLDSWRA